jgi:peptidyl-prolyl cis-trans isomerase SurA
MRRILQGFPYYAGCAAILFSPGALRAQAPAPSPAAKTAPAAATAVTAIPAASALAPAAVPAPASKGVLLDEIVARVNNDIISLSDFQKADDTLRKEVAQDCQACAPEKMEAEYKDKQKDLLRDLIDQSLLVQRAKDMGVSVETDLVKRLDEIRKENNIPSLEALEKAVEGEGMNWEDYKTQLRNSLLTQEVIHKEVGSRIDIGHDEVQQYYDAHKTEFIRPEQVVLAEIFLSTEKKTPDEMILIQKKAQALHDRVEKGEDFNELAKHYSEGGTAKEGGGLGGYERGQLSKQLEDVVFKMDKGQISDVIQTKTGFEVLKVIDHFQAGQQPMEKVENEIMNRIYMQKMQPNLRTYLAQLREESYVTVKPGFTDSAAMTGGSVIQETAPTADTQDSKKKKMPKPKVNS